MFPSIHHFFFNRLFILSPAHPSIYPPIHPSTHPPTHPSIRRYRGNSLSMRVIFQILSPCRVLKRTYSGTKETKFPQVVTITASRSAKTVRRANKMQTEPVEILMTTVIMTAAAFRDRLDDRLRCCYADNYDNNYINCYKDCKKLLKII